MPISSRGNKFNEYRVHLTKKPWITQDGSEKTFVLEKKFFIVQSFFTYYNFFLFLKKKKRKTFLPFYSFEPQLGTAKSSISCVL